MIGRTFYKRLRLLNGSSETVTTRFELDEATGQLIEHVTMQTHLCATIEADPPADVESELTSVRRHR